MCLFPQVLGGYFVVLLTEGLVLAGSVSGAARQVISFEKEVMSVIEVLYIDPCETCSELFVLLG